MRKFFLSLCMTVFLFTFAKAQFMGFGHNWVPGYFYDLNGKKNMGLLADYIKERSLFDGPDKFFLYKKDKDADKIKELAKNVRSFVVEKDSFVVSNSDILEETPFLDVAIDHPLKLYATRLPRHVSVMGPVGAVGPILLSAGVSFSYTTNKYYFGTSPDSITALSRKNFIEIMSKIMADKPEIVGKIQDRTYRYSDIDDLLVLYITGKQPVNDTSNSGEN